MDFLAKLIGGFFVAIGLFLSIWIICVASARVVESGSDLMEPGTPLADARHEREMQPFRAEAAAFELKRQEEAAKTETAQTAQERTLEQFSKFADAFRAVHSVHWPVSEDFVIPSATAPYRANMTYGNSKWTIYFESSDGLIWDPVRIEAHVEGLDVSGIADLAVEYADLANRGD